LTLPREPGDDSRPDSVGKPFPGIEMLVSRETDKTELKRVCMQRLSAIHDYKASKENR